MATILRVGGGGSAGGSLDLTVVGGTTQPENPKNNTLWINTDVAFEEVHLAPTQPILHSTTKNLFCCPLPSQSSENFTYYEDGHMDFIVNANETKGFVFQKSAKTFWLPAGTYTVSGSPSETDLTTGVISIGVYGIETEAVIATSESGQPAVFTLDVDTNVYLRIGYVGNEDASGDTITIPLYPQIEEGEIATEFVKGVRDNAVWVNTSNRYQSDASAIASTTHVLEVAEDPFLRINVLQFKQWDGTAWVWRDGGIYANNAWTDMALYIYWYGTVNENCPLGTDRGSRYYDELDLATDTPTYEDDHFYMLGSTSDEYKVCGVRDGHGIDVSPFTTMGIKFQKTEGKYDKTSTYLGLRIGFSTITDGTLDWNEATDAQEFNAGDSTDLQELTIPITCSGVVRPTIKFVNLVASDATALHINVYYWVLT